MSSYMDTVEDAVDLFGNLATVRIDEDATRRALDELFRLTHQYNPTKAYDALLKVVARFRFYAPYNAMLIHIQMTGAKFVASPIVGCTTSGSGSRVSDWAEQRMRALRVRVTAYAQQTSSNAVSEE